MRFLRTDRVVKFPLPSIDLPFALLAYHSDTIALIFHEGLLRKALVQMLVDMCILNASRTHGTLGSVAIIRPIDTPSSGIVLTCPDAPHHLPRVNARGEFASLSRQAVTAASARGRRRGVRADDLPPARRVVLDPGPRVHDDCTRPALGGIATAAGGSGEAVAGPAETEHISTGNTSTGSVRRGGGWNR